MSWSRVSILALAFGFSGGLALAQQPAPADDWKMISEEDGYTLWAGKPKPVDAQLSVDILFKYEQPRLHLDQWFYKSVRQNFQFDCKANTYRVISLEMFTDEWGTSEVLYRRKFSYEPLDIAEGSRAAAYSKAVCDSGSK